MSDSVDITHKKVSGVADSPDTSLVRPTDWNEKHNFGTVNFFDFNLLFAGLMQEGRVAWDNDAGTLKIGLPGGNVNIQVGQEHVVKVYNDSGADIPNGAAVCLTGAHAQWATIGLADNRSYARALCFGLATEEIRNNNYGYVTTAGIVRDIDTDHLVEGAPCWLGHDGAVTSVRPTSPELQYVIGACTNKHAATGKISVFLDAFKRLSHLSDVLVSAIADLDILRWDTAAQVWRNYHLFNRWDDLRVEPTIRLVGPNSPTFEKWYDDGGVSRGVYLYSFDDSAQEKEVHFNMQMPHDWDGGSVHLHVHWIGNQAGAGQTPRWGLEWNMAGIGKTFGVTTITYAVGNVQGDVNIVQNKHYITEIISFIPSADQGGISAILNGRLFRNSTSGIDTYNGAKCGLEYIDAHYVRDTFGSNTEYVK